MSEVALASINSFAYIEGKANSSVQPDENAIVLVPIQVLRDLLREGQSLRVEVQDLRTRLDALDSRISEPPSQRTTEQEIQAFKATTARLSELEDLQELHHGPAPAQEDRPGLREAFARRREALDSLPSRVYALEEDLAVLEGKIQAPRERPPAPGSKTETRIARMREVLKERGPTTFKEMEKLLDISPREMLRITKRLDLRHYEISRRPGDARQKVIKLRAQIR